MITIATQPTPHYNAKNKYPILTAKEIPIYFLDPERVTPVP